MTVYCTTREIQCIQCFKSVFLEIQNKAIRPVLSDHSHMYVCISWADGVNKARSCRENHIELTNRAWPCASTINKGHFEWITMYRK